MRALWVAVVVAAACANASHNTDQQPEIDAPKSAIDAKTSSTTDAPPQHPNDAPPANIDAFVPPVDAPKPVDAFIPPTPDASTDGNICTAQSQCTDAGECCLDLGTGIGICTQGTLLGSTCFPIS